MSDDWVKKYAEAHQQKQHEKKREEQEAQEKLRLARAVAPDMFQRIKDRVEHDVNALHRAGVLQSVQFNNMEEQGFTVNDLTPHSWSQPTLAVELDVIVVKYYHHFPPKKGEKADYKSDGSLRICADLQGIAQVYRNGSKTPFTDEAEISEFLLKPLLDYVSSL